MRKHFFLILRLLVTLAAVGAVIYQITWKDRLIGPESPADSWGRLHRIGDKEVFRADSGKETVLTPELKTTKFVPGFLTLIWSINRWLFIGVLFYFPLQTIFLTIRWQWLLRTHGLDPGFLEALRLTLIGMLANNVLPSSTGGDFVKGWCIYRRSPGKRLPAIMTVLIDRVLGLVSLLIIGAVMMIAERHRPELAEVSRLAFGILFAIVGGGIVFFSSRMRKLLYVDTILGFLPFSAQIKSLDNSLYHYRHHGMVMAACVLVSFVVHFFTITSCYFLDRALGVGVPLVDYAIFLPMVFTAGAFIPAIAGLGVLEGFFQTFFAQPAIGATPSGAVAVCILYRVVALVTALPGAVPMFHEFSAAGVKIIGGAEEDDQPTPT